MPNSPLTGLQGPDHFPLPPIAVRRTASLRSPMRSPCCFEKRDAKHRYGWGDFVSSPPTPAHSTNVKFAEPPRPKRGEGNDLFAVRSYWRASLTENSPLRMRGLKFSA